MSLLSDSDMVTVMEIARIALEDAAIFDDAANRLDLSDNALLDLSDRLQKNLDEHGYAIDSNGNVSYVKLEKR